MKKILLSLLLFMMSTLAFSQPPLPDGAWSSIGVWDDDGGTLLRLLALDANQGIYAASAFWSSGPQTDSFAGMGKLEGTVLSITPTMHDDDGPQYAKKSCRIVVRFNADFKKATIQSSQCAPLQHPAFEGQPIVLNKKQE